MGNQWCWTGVKYRFVVTVNVAEVAPAKFVDDLALVIEVIGAVDCRIHELQIDGVRILSLWDQIRKSTSGAIPAGSCLGKQRGTAPSHRLVRDMVWTESHEETVGLLFPALNFVNVRVLAWE